MDRQQPELRTTDLRSQKVKSFCWCCSSTERYKHYQQVFPSLTHSLTHSLSLFLLFVKSEICPKTTEEEDNPTAAIRMLGNNRWKAYGASLLRRRVQGPFLIILFSCPPTPFPSLVIQDARTHKGCHLTILNFFLMLVKNVTLKGLFNNS